MTSSVDDLNIVTSVGSLITDISCQFLHRYATPPNIMYPNAKKIW